MTAGKPVDRCPERGGFTLIEMVIAIALTAAIMVALGAVTKTSLDSSANTRARNALARDARFAMDRMVRAVRGTRLLVLPLGDKSSTPQDESVLDPGVLSVAMDERLDRDLDGFADADNDRDTRVDEDWPRDINADGAPGIAGIDDNVDGIPDGSFAGSPDDDETGFLGDEDPVNGIDDDDDGLVDEDPGDDMSGDGAPGLLGVDDDGDGAIDEGGDSQDDDEDGAANEDWLDTVTFFLSGSALIERHPNLGAVDGTDYTERTIAQGVSAFRVERVPQENDRAQLVDLSLDLGAGAVTVSVQTRVRVGSGL